MTEPQPGRRHELARHLKASADATEAFFRGLSAADFERSVYDHGAAWTLREEGLETKCVTLKIRYADFKTHTFSHTLPEPTALDQDIVAVLHKLLPKAQERRARVRLEEPVRAVSPGQAAVFYGAECDEQYSCWTIGKSPRGPGDHQS